MPYLHVYYHFSRECYALPKDRAIMLIKGKLIFWFNDEWTALCSAYTLIESGKGFKL